MKNTARSNEQELLDLGPSHYTQEEYEECLNQLARIGCYLGGNRATLLTLFKLSKPQTILDVGCGGGHFAIQLAKQFPQSQVIGIDISTQAIEFAKQRLQETSLKNIKFENTPSAQFAFPTDSFDIVTSTLVCHHLNDDELIEFLKDSYQIAKQAVVINDLHRHWLAYCGFALIAKACFRNRLIYHDGLLSIKRAFKRQDWIYYLNAAGIPLTCCSIHWYWPFR